MKDKHLKLHKELFPKIFEKSLKRKNGRAKRFNRSLHEHLIVHAGNLGIFRGGIKTVMFNNTIFKGVG